MIIVLNMYFILFIFSVFTISFKEFHWMFKWVSYVNNSMRLIIYCSAYEFLLLNKKTGPSSKFFLLFELLEFPLKRSDHSFIRKVSWFCYNIVINKTNKKYYYQAPILLCDVNVQYFAARCHSKVNIK